MLATNRHNYSALLTKVGTVKATPAEIADNKGTVARKWFELGKSDRTCGLGCRWPRIADYNAGFNYDSAQPLYLTDALCAQGAVGYRFICTIHSNTFPYFRETVDVLAAVPSLRSLNRLVKERFGSDAYVSSFEAQTAPF